MFHSMFWPQGYGGNSNTRSNAYGRTMFQLSFVACCYSLLMIHSWLMIGNCLSTVYLCDDSDLHEALMLLLLLFWMWHLGYLASFVTMVTGVIVCGRLLCGEGLWRQGWDLGAVLIQVFSKLQTAALSQLLYLSIYAHGHCAIDLLNIRL